MNHSLIPDNLSDFKYCYRRDRSLVFWTFLAGLCIGYISYLLTKGGHAEAIFLWGLTALLIFRAIWVVCDNSVKFCFNEEGLFSKGRWINTSEIDSYQVIERRDGAQLKYFLDLSLKDGSQERIQLSGLNKPAHEVLIDLSQQFEVPPSEEP